MPGFPIRTSSDQRSIDNSPRLNAALHVLHRLSMPRHPPCALNNEHTTTTNNHHTTCSNHQQWREHTKHKKNKEITQTTTHHQHKEDGKHMVKCSRPLYSSHTTPHTRQQPKQTSQVIETYVGYTTREQCPRHPTMHHVLFKKC